MVGAWESVTSNSCATRKAVEALQRAFDLDYEPSETSFQMAFAYARRKQEKEALKWLETAAALGFDRLSEAMEHRVHF